MILFTCCIGCEELFVGTDSSWLKPEVIISVFVPIITFIGGYLLSRYSDKKKEKSRLETIQSFVFESIEVLQPKIKAQVECFREFSKKIHILDRQIPEMGRVNMNLHSLETISDVDFYKTFVLNKKGDEHGVKKNSKALFNLTGSINFLTSSNQNSYDQHELYINSQKENADTMKKIFDEYLRLRAFIIGSRGGMEEFKAALDEEVQRVAQEQIASGNTLDNIDWDIFIISTQKTISICSDYIAKHRLSEAIELLDVAHRLVSTHKLMVDTNTIFSQKYSQIADDFEDGFKEILEAKDVLSNSKFKRAFEINQ